MSVFPSSQRYRRVVVALLLLAIAVVGVSLVYARSSRVPKADKAMAATVTNLPQAVSSNPGAVELIDLRPSGFEPSEITRPAGRFLLRVNNRTGPTDLSLMLVQESGKSEGIKRLSRMKTWREVLDLQPGRYVLREATHRDWLCHITITER